jgi:putative flavoprotein involved in K+ transport
MVQRSSTHVVRASTILATDLGPHRREGPKHSIRDADLLLASVPYKIIHRFSIELNKRIAEMDAGFYRALEAAGFMHDFGDDGSGFVLKFLRRGSGYYIDLGASELLIKGDIALKSNVTVTEMRERSVVLSDGSEVDADLVVYATGYRSMNERVAKLISQDVADKVGKCWGLGSNTTKDPGPWERELRNMWKPTQQPHLWFQGGGFLDCRHYSLYLALQIKARMEGIPGIHVYGMGNPHHTM